MLQEICLCLVGYFWGSVPTGALLAKGFGGLDIKKTGSGNIGATNVYRVMGKKMGILTLAGDALKGIIPLILAFHFTSSSAVISIVALAAFIGHLYPIFLNFRGGKGVATSLGIFLVLAPLAVLVVMGIFGLVVLFFRYVSLGSIISAASMPFLMALFGYPFHYIGLSFLIALLIVYRHWDNIKRLTAGEERKLGARS